ncbi:MAG: hypothetical protein K5682_01850 [Lachnospiraceae bacterium]|nr:hypothetical protein [Lachnospiraceae bacterium]
MIQLPRLLGDGSILQQGKPIHIWGWVKGEPEEEAVGLTISLTEEGGDIVHRRQIKAEGRFDVYFSALEAGHTLSLLVKDDRGNEARSVNLRTGEVILCSGQSNMELPMERVKYRYPEEIEGAQDPDLRCFKVTEYANFHGPEEEHLSGCWKSVSPETIRSFSATGYFFGKELRALSKVPVGLIDCSLGGTLISSWMSREMLQEYPELLAQADQYADDDFLNGRKKTNEENAARWYGNLERTDIGNAQHWENPDIFSPKDCKDRIDLPVYLEDTPLKGFIGSFWITRTFQVPQHLAGRSMRLWLGTIVDNDVFYINGIKVGETPYQYPPRKYVIPEGVLKAGENIITGRIHVENGEGRFTPNKKYAIFSLDTDTSAIDADQSIPGEDEINLAGTWYYRIGCTSEQVPPTDFVNWKPTGLFNGMTAPCHNFPLGGIIWYQGESNTGEKQNYTQLTRAMVEGYRRLWQDPEIPYWYVQLPNYMADLKDETGWPALREMQRRCDSIPLTGMVVAYDLGEDYDLHPTGKKRIGKRLAHLHAAFAYHYAEGAESPFVSEVFSTRDGLLLHTDGVRSLHADHGSVKLCPREDLEILDFEAEDTAGNRIPLKVSLEGRDILLENVPEDVTAICYCYSNTNKGALIYGDNGLPLSPFRMEI